MAAISSDAEFLAMASTDGDLDACRYIVEKRPSTIYEVIGLDGFTALHYAAEEGQVNIARYLITADTKADSADMVELGYRGKTNKRLLMIQTTGGKTALHVAVENRQHEVIKMLIEADRDFEALRMVDNNQRTCLHSAAEISDNVAAKLIIEARPDIEFLKITNSEGQTVLHIAAKRNDMTMVRLLIEADRENELMEMVDSFSRTALHYAALGGNLKMVKLILQACGDQAPGLVKMADSEENTILHLAAMSGDLDTVRFVTEELMISDYCANKRGRTPLFLAMAAAAADDKPGSDAGAICRLLLEKDPSQCPVRLGLKGWTPLHQASDRGYLSLVKDILRFCPDCPKLVDTDGRNSIHIAVNSGHLDIVKYYLETGVDSTVLNTQDSDGNTPLHIAVLRKNKPVALCLLYDKRVNKGIENYKMEKAIDLITFPYDEAKARVYSLGHQRDLKDQNSFDLLVAVLIATVSFTAGITVPGGYENDGTNKGSAILLKSAVFNVFVISNNIALLFSMYTVFLNFSTRRLLKEEDIYYESNLGTFRTRLLLKKKDMIHQLNTATLCTLSAVYAMVVAFITGSYAVLSKSDGHGLAITVCVSSGFFLVLASHATWKMAMQYLRSKSPTD